MTDSTIKQFLHELQQLSKAESIPCVGGRSDLPTQPGLKVKGRPISLPVSREELGWLGQQGRESPFGKGMDTIVDADIRRSMEFEAQEVALLNPRWQPALEQLISSVATQMGIDFQIEAELFKLLIYREGGHFKFHQDTEKAPGMFATLIVQLPSRCQGGSLVCRFADKEYCFDFGNKEADAEFSIYYAAHYADVHHQVETITEGARLVLIYNLIQPASERQLSANHHSQLLNSVRGRVAPIFPLLSREQHAFLLQHEYTEQSLSDLGFLAAKGQDRDLLQALLAINERLSLEQTLYFMIGRISYSVTSDGCGGYYGGGDEDDIHWEEIESTSPRCDLCFDEGGQKIPAGNLGIDWIHDLNQKEVRSITFSEINEDFWGKGYDEIEGFMGNYGPTKETTYARYLLVVMLAYPDNPGAFQDAAFEAHRVSLMARDLQSYPERDWLRERFNKALQEVLTQFNSMVGEKEMPYHWHSRFDKGSRAIFTKLIQTAIAMDDRHLCQNLISTASASLIVSLSSEFQAKSVLRLLKEALDHFGWERLSASYTALLTALPGDASLSTAMALAENNADKTMRSQLMELCVNTICREQDVWGERQYSFKDTILPLVVNLCKTGWHAADQAKELLLATCLEKGAEHPSFLSVLIQNLIADTQADDKEWLLPALITTRLNYLEGELQREPQAFTWSMPNASTGKKAITVFLRGAGQQGQITGYDGIALARNDVVDLEPAWILPEFYMESNADFVQPKVNHGFSARMEAKGRGKKAFVEVKKDKRYYELCLKLRELRKREFNKLRKIVGAKKLEKNG